LNTFISLWLKFFFLLTPFFALSMFLSLTSACDADTRKRLALRIGGQAGESCFAKRLSFRRALLAGFVGDGGAVA
jgi:multiple antibiotic resistance protein